MNAITPLLTVVLVSNLLTTGIRAQACPESVPPVSIFTPSARVLFQGDSITDGKRGRDADPNHILGHGYVFIISALYGAAFPGKNLTFINRGVSGNTVIDLRNRWQQDTLDQKPDVLSLLIGVNDNQEKLPLDQYERDYDELLTAAGKANPHLRLVLGEPFGLPSGKHQEDWETWSAALKQRSAVVAKLARKHNAAFVPYQKAFDEACRKAPAEHWIWDGIHPTYSGHQIMANTWLEAVRMKWPAK